MEVVEEERGGFTPAPEEEREKVQPPWIGASGLNQEPVPGPNTGAVPVDTQNPARLLSSVHQVTTP